MSVAPSLGNGDDKKNTIWPHPTSILVRALDEDFSKLTLAPSFKPTKFRNDDFPRHAFAKADLAHFAEDDWFFQTNHDLRIRHVLIPGIFNPCFFYLSVYAGLHCVYIFISMLSDATLPGIA